VEDREEHEVDTGDPTRLGTAVDAGDPIRLSRQELGREVAERADHTRPDQLDLGEQVALAGGDLVGLRIAVARGPALEHVGDVHLRPGQTDRLEQAFENLAGLADERHALLVLVVAGRLADEHQVGVGITRPDHDLRARRGEGALLAPEPLAGEPVELDRTGGSIAHRAHCLSRAGRPRV
jgi:hypothetical protein